MTGERPRSQSSGTPNSHSMNPKCGQNALHGAAAVVQDAIHPRGHEWLRASSGRAAARGAPQEPEGGEAKPRPERLQHRGDRPGAVVASEEHRRCNQRRRPPNDRTPHMR